jgi:hypothetical protein
MQNPMAQQLQSMGRGEDSMLVHMTPGEVNSLQGLAMAAGGSLTVNPQTGLPEASFLKKLLPMIAGIGLNFLLPGSGIVASLGGKAATAGLLTGAASTAITGDLSKGLMAGLGAFGGASLAGGAQAAFGAGAKTAAAGAPPIPESLLKSAAQGQAPAGGITMAGAQTAASAAAPTATMGIPGLGVQAAAPGAAAKASGTLGRFGQGFAETARGGMTGLAGKAAPYAAGLGALNTLSEATAPQMPRYNPDDDKFEYVPMGPGVREVRFQTPEQIRASGGREFQYFTPTNPDPVPLSERPRGFAEGGTASAPPQGFDELVQYFGSINPGAITAPNAYPSTTPAAPSAPAPRGEVIHDFRQPGTTARNLGITDGFGPYGTFGGMGGFNFNAADYDAAISRLRGELGISSPSGVQPSAPPTMTAPPQQSPGNSGFGGGFDEQRPVLDSVPNDFDFRGYVPDFAQTFTPAEAPAPMPIAPAPAPAPAPMPIAQAPLPDAFDYRDVYTPTPMPITQPSIRPAPDAPPIMLDPSQAENYGGPYYTTMTEEAGYSPGYGGGGGRGMFDEFRVDQYAQGGAVNMRDGSFVVDARTVSEIGNGSSNAGIEALSRMGGRPVRGPGDGVSDSVKASIGGKQEARVARDEVIFSPEAVRRLGGGSDAKGTKKLYALMNKAHNARKKAKRGQDTGVRRGLA